MKHKSSERISHSKMKAKAIAEFRHVVIPRLACIIWRMNAHTKIKAKNKEVEVVAQAKTCAKRQFVHDIFHLQLATRMRCIIVH